MGAPRALPLPIECGREPPLGRWRLTEEDVGTYVPKLGDHVCMVSWRVVEEELEVETVPSSRGLRRSLIALHKAHTASAGGSGCESRKSATSSAYSLKSTLPISERRAYVIILRFEIIDFKVFRIKHSYLSIKRAEFLQIFGI